MAYFIGEKEENVLNVRNAVNGVRFSLIQCDDGTYTARIEASGLKRPADFFGNYDTYYAFSNIINSYIDAARDEGPTKNMVEEEATEEETEEETEGEG